MRTAGVLLVPLFILALVACSTPEPTPDIPATVEAEVQRQMVAELPTATASLSPTPLPTLEPISRPTPTAMPTFTRSTASTPTLPPTAKTAQAPITAAVPTVGNSNSDNFPGERVLTVDQLQKETFDWKDGEPFLLIACNTGASVRSGGVVFSNDGAYSEERYLVVVYRGPRPKQEFRDCYSLPVVFDGTTRYCFVRAGSFMPQTAGVSQTCRGWEQTATPSFYRAPGHSSQSISQEEWFSLQP